VNTLANLLDNTGIHVDPDEVKIKNVAAVMVTAEMPVFARIGSRLNVQVSSIGDATSLQGGTLLMTPLQGPDGKVYALAQGPISVGGFVAAGASGGTVQKNHATVGQIPGGAVVEREVPFSLQGRSELDLVLRRPDFRTAQRTAEAINDALGGATAKALDSATVRITVPAEMRDDMVGMIAAIEGLDVAPDSVAKVVVNERTGTIVMGEHVTISPVAVAHGSITIQITEQPVVSQPPPFSPGQTVTVPQTAIDVTEGSGSLQLVQGVTIGQVVKGLNAIGATAQDLITILQTIKAAGALQAELEIM
ncbi:MAG: flagellar basal body P-ring protein FlgI, partial [Bacteroidetes bacterium]